MLKKRPYKSISRFYVQFGQVLTLNKIMQHFWVINKLKMAKIGLILIYTTSKIFEVIQNIKIFLKTQIQLYKTMYNIDT